MPSIATHHVFADMVFNELNNKIQNTFKVEKQIYYTFAQSHDYLFYSFNKKVREIGHTAHHRETQNYLINIVKEIKEKKLENEQSCIAYLHGAVTHYCLDTTCHPFVFYKTGIYYKDLPERHKYRNEHTHMEKHLDAYYYTKYYKKDYTKVSINKDIIKKPVINTNLENLISKVYKETYNVDNIGNYYRSSIKQAKLINIFINDKTGIKQAIAKTINVFTKSHPEYYTTYIKQPILDFLNLERKTWNHPCNTEETFNYSFDDLMNIAKKKCLNIIKEIDKVIYHNQDIKTLYDVILDLDYATGYKIEDNKMMRYFAY